MQKMKLVLPPGEHVVTLQLPEVQPGTRKVGIQLNAYHPDEQLQKQLPLLLDHQARYPHEMGYLSFRLRGPSKWWLHVNTNDAQTFQRLKVKVDTLNGYHNDLIPSLAELYETRSFMKPVLSVDDADNLAQFFGHHIDTLKWWRAIKQIAVDDQLQWARSFLEIRAYKTGIDIEMNDRILHGWRWQMHVWTPSDKSFYDQALIEPLPEPELDAEEFE